MEIMNGELSAKEQRYESSLMMRHEANRTLDRGDGARNLISCGNATHPRVDSVFSQHRRDFHLTFLFCG